MVSGRPVAYLGLVPRYQLRHLCSVYPLSVPEGLTKNDLNWKAPIKELSPHPVAVNLSEDIPEMPDGD
jgi:hypothetical protein